MPFPAGDITLLLRRMDEGDPSAADALFTSLYDALRAQARAAVGPRSRSGSRSSTIQPTDLVNEVYMKLVRQRTTPVDRSHFFAVAAHAMRSILVDHVKSRGRRKRRATGRRVELQDLAVEFEERAVDLLDLDAALRRLAEHSERSAQIVELRFFAGLDLPAIARTLGVHVRTVKRDWQYARAWLHAELA